MRAELLGINAGVPRESGAVTAADPPAREWPPIPPPLRGERHGLPAAPTAEVCRGASSRGFTVTETLVALAILAVLAGLLFPVIAQVRLRSGIGTCFANRRQLGGAVGMYAADYDGCIPYARDALDANVDPGPPDAIQQVLREYGARGEVFHCPLDREINPDHFVLRWSGPSWYSNVGSSYAYDENHALKRWSLTTYPHPGEDLLMWEYDGFHNGLGTRLGIHGVLFADLHAKDLTWDRCVRAIDNP